MLTARPCGFSMRSACCATPTTSRSPTCRSSSTSPRRARHAIDQRRFLLVDGELRIYLRGYNLMQLGRFAEADALVSKVATRLPQFGEAALTAALLAHQQGKKPVAPFSVSS